MLPESMRYSTSGAQLLMIVCTESGKNAGIVKTSTDGNAIITSSGPKPFCVTSITWRRLGAVAGSTKSSNSR